ncbi:muscular LMNA-interacting protein isoform X10 [Ovis aries]|uniref:muscular LMNA-interacting protein isoform X10 n=1 Tax=Ovis aries TaxID=9940 RepID=UPI0029528691|nr:muscular LMNA-interacting protein isoform X10 [Ovis aries]
MDFEKHGEGSLLNENLEEKLTFDSSEYLTLNVGHQQEREQGALTCPSEVEDKASQGKEFKEKKPQGMQQSDLFKAEYVFIVDSEGEEEVPGRKGDQGPPVGTGPPAARPSSLAISSSLASDAVRPKTRAAGLQAPSHPERPQAMAPPQRHGQKTPPAPGELAGASVLEEFHSRRLDAHGALVEETTTYFQTSAHSAPFFAPKGTSSTSQVPQPAQLSGSPSSSPSTAQQNLGQTSEVLKKTVNSNGLSPKESPRASSSPASGASLKPSAASYIPVRIVTHSLSPSPRAFPSPFHGSSSTVCSQASSSASLSRSGVKPPVPSRLSVLTAILKSSPSHQRPLSPASCPTFSLNSLASSTLTLDQKVKQTSPTPKKSLSSCSLRSGSPEQRENPVSDLSQPSFPFPSPAKATPPPQASALSTPKQGSSSFASVIVEKMPPPTLKSSPVTSQLQTGTSSSVGLPPVPPSFSPLSSKGRQDADPRSPGKPRDICSHAYTSPSSTSSSVSPPTNPRARLSSPERRYHPSPALSNLINRSKSAQAPVSGQGQTLSTPPPAPVSSSSSASLPHLGSSALPLANPPTKAHRLSPSALHPNLTLPSRLGKSESSISDHRSSVSALSPPFSLTRTKELSSPCALPMSAGPENKKPKALDEPAKTDSISKDKTLDPPLELCSPAQLRQQTEELCATIDKVLQDSLSMHSSDSPSSSLQTLLGSDTIKMPTTLPRAAGRETKYANLSSPSSTVSESQLTKPGVIRPVPVKSKILLKKEEEVYEPNPFSKYLEDNSDFFSEQDVPVPPKPVSLHPLYQTRLHPTAKSLLRPQTRPHADCLTPGPFSHLSSFSLSDEQENSHTLFSHNAYNKLSHPMMAIPEHETLDSKEIHTAAAAAAKLLPSCLTLRPHRRQPTRLPCPWDSPGKNTGVGCHFPLQCMKVKSESEVAQSRLTPSNPMDCSPPGSSIHAIFQQ